MPKLKLVFRALKELINFHSMQSSCPQITFYSEDENYWPHLKGLLKAVLSIDDIEVLYVSSSINDPGLKFKHKDVQSLYIGKGFIRDYFFKNLKTKVMVLTMPDLNNYQIKKSVHEVHYVYVQHSLVSLHMVYRENAFDHYDSVCVAGPHHVKELEKMWDNRGIVPKSIIKIGYSKYDSMLTEQYKKPENLTTNGCDRTILIAPSWGENGIIETGVCFDLVDQLLQLNNFVILRPHPETIKKSEQQLNKIANAYMSHQSFHLECDVSSQNSFYIADIMISDWSGAALEFALALHKPVIFCDIKRKINNPNYQKVDIVPIEVALREKVGVIWDLNTPIDRVLAECKTIDAETLVKISNKYVFNIGFSDEKFSQQMKKLLKGK